MEVKNPGQFKKGNMPWNKGMFGYSSAPRSDEWKKNIQAGLKKHYDAKGRKSQANKLARGSVKYTKWRKDVFDRDGYACRECGSKTNIHPHHIKSFSEYPHLRYCVDNGKALCSKCHGEVHGMDFDGAGRHITCQVCGVRFRPKGGHLLQKTCSVRCGNKLKASRDSPLKGKKRPELYRKPDSVCKGCGEMFRPRGEITGKNGSQKRRIQKYCSHACYLKARWNYTGKQAIHAETGEPFPVEVK